jgi:peptide/nickel transport system substrate-binding protein
MNHKSTISAAAVALVAAVALAGCSSGSNSSEPKKALTLTLAETLQNDTFDPAKLTGGSKDHYWEAVYDTVVQYDVSSKKYVPDLAKSWSYNKAGTVLTVHLRNDVKFNDGSALTADALVKNGLALKNGGGSSAFMMANVTDIKAVDSTTAEYRLSSPDPAFLGYLATIGGAIANPKSVGSTSLATVPDGTGPYVYDQKDSVPGSIYTFTKKKNYWNSAAYPYSKLVLKPISDASAVVNALKSHQVQGAPFDPSAVDQIKASGLDVTTNSTDWMGLVLADWKGQITPALGDVRVRQAINYAIDGDGILKSVLNGNGTPTTQVFAPGDAAYVKSLDSKYPYNVKKAKSLLAAAGYPEGFTVTMPQFDFVGSYQQFVVQQLAAVGIKVTIAPGVPSDYLANAKAGKYSMFFLQLTSGDPWRNASKLFPVGSTWNGFKVDLPEVDSLMAKAQKDSVSDQAAYKADLQGISTYAVENALYDPWFRVTNFYATDGSFTVRFSPLVNLPYLKDIQPVK